VRRAGVGAARRPAFRGLGAPGLGPPLGLIIGGQSNAGGQGALVDVPANHNRNQSQIRMVDPSDDGALIPATEPTAAERAITTPGAGSAVAIANRLIEAHGWRRGIRISTRSWAGSALHWHWLDPNAGGDADDAMPRWTARAQTALTASMPAVGVWYQGETETANTTLTAAWPARCTSLLGQMRTALGRPSMPFIVVRLPPTVPDPPEDRPYWADMRTGQATLHETDGGLTVVVDAPDGPFDDSAGLHLGALAQIALGELIADEIASRWLASF
jgi:hypothetical protein